jgi:glycogen debranching enzyme
MPISISTMLTRLRPRYHTQYVAQGRTVLATGLDGFIDEGSEHGLFVHETRLLSRYRYLINGERPTPVALSNVEQHSWLGYYIQLPPGIDGGDADTGSGQVQAASQQTLELRLARYAGDGLHEDVDLTNYSQQPTSFWLELDVDADFADQVEASGTRRRRGTICREWRQAGVAWELLIDYRAKHAYAHQGKQGTAAIHRGLQVRIERSGSPASVAGGTIAFRVSLPPRGRWHACVEFGALIEGCRLAPQYGCRSFSPTRSEYDLRRRTFQDEATRFESPQASGLAPVVIGAVDQAKRDLAALRLYDLDHGERAWTMAAGLPIYIALFGRDVLTASWQAALASTAMMRGTLRELAKWQGRDSDDWRDEQPGRMLHEAHTGPLEALNVNPRARYYGSVTTSAFYPVIVSELWHWTGDETLVRPLAETALRALRWLDDGGDLDGDGFYEYQTRSEKGVTNQGWKDSGDAIVYEDGSQVKPPIATCEEQAFVYIGKLHLSEVLWWLGAREDARRLYRQAGELRRRFNDAFWMEDAGFIAMGLDGDKRQIRSIGSNAGHCLAAAIVDPSRVLRAAGRLVARDLFSGWGIRTLGAEHPAYNPYSYHRGSVWPVEHGSFALGFMRYGLWQHLELVARAQFDAAALFDYYRLPEVFSGHPRDADHPFPALYPQANSPQAWSSSAVVCLLQAMLGLYPYAPLHLVVVDPHLPEWLPEITLRELRVGAAVVTIRFYREASGNSDYQVLDQRGRLHVVRQPTPWSLTATFAERLVDALTSFLPGR